MTKLHQNKITKNIGFNNNFHKINEIGLKKAYENPNKVHVDGDKLFIAGTSNKQDIIDDITKVPFWGDVRKSERYLTAIDTINKNPQINKLISHSLGGSVALELEKGNPKFETTTYGAPVFDPISFKRGNRFRHPLDPVSILDRGAKTVDFISFNPIKAHSYSNFT